MFIFDPALLGVVNDIQQVATTTLPPPGELDYWRLLLQADLRALALVGQALSFPLLLATVYLAVRNFNQIRHQQLRNEYTGQISNIHSAYVQDWKEKTFIRPVEVTVYARPDGTRYARDLGKAGNPGDTKTNDASYVNRLDVRNLVRRHLRFNYIQDGDDYERVKRALLEFWERSKQERTWEKTACYNMTGSLQDLGILVRTGALPASYVFMSAGRHVIEEWIYSMELVYADFRRPGHNISLPAPSAGSELGAMRRHAEWLACACAIYWHNHYLDGYVNFFIAEMERACKSKEHRLSKASTTGLYNFGDRIDLRLPLDISCIRKRERTLFPLDMHLVHPRIADSINADINDILQPDNPHWKKHGINASRRQNEPLPEVLKSVRHERARLMRRMTKGKLSPPAAPANAVRLAGLKGSAKRLTFQDRDGDARH